MQSTSSPAKIPQPFAVTGDKTATIPQAASGVTVPGHASWDIGFPPVTMIPVASGGIAPYGQDFNALFYNLTSAARWNQAGGFYKYDSAFATDGNVNGYPKGATLLKSDGSGLWWNSVEGNTTNPDSGGTGWADFFSGTSGTVSLTDLASTAFNKGAALVGRGLPVVDSISSLRSLLKTSAATRALVTGYYSAGDGGGDPFYYDASDTSSADNGMTIIVATDGGRWKRVLNGPLTAKKAGAKGDGLTDDTARIQAALTIGGHLIIDAGYVFCATELNMIANQNLTILGTLRRTGGTGPFVEPAANCAIFGPGTIDCNSITYDAIAASNTTKVRIHGVIIQNTGAGGKGIAAYSGCTKWQILFNVVQNCNGTLIDVEYGGGHIIGYNRCENDSAIAQHGIMWWGGDSNVSSTIGVTDIVIVGNRVKNVLGGIWGSLGSHITVTGNNVENCSDVGIDFEGCSHFTCTGNTALECQYGCYSIFYGCSDGVFSGNTGTNIVYTGAGFYATTNSTYINTRIKVTGNNFSTIGPCIYADANGNKSLTNSAITDNTLFSNGNRAISILENTNLLIAMNHCTTSGSGVGIGLEGVSASIVRDNTLFGFGDPSSAPTSAGGIFLYRRSSTYPSRYNVVRGNRIDSYNYSINDACTGDVTQSYNHIADNYVTNIYRSTGGTYNGVIASNLNLFNPATTVTATAF